jgi:hypothetical protein
MVAALLLSTRPSWGYSIGPYNAKIIYVDPDLHIKGITYFNDKIYAIDEAPRHIFQIDQNTGAVVTTWDTSMEETTMLSGLANDGTKMYACNRNTIYTVLLGTPPNSVNTPIGPIADDYPACDLVYGDGLLWSPIYISSKINKYDPISGAKIGSIPSPSGFVYSIAFDGTNLILADWAFSKQMWKVSTTGEVLDSWAAPAMLGTFSMAYDFSSETLLIAKGVPEPTSMAMIGTGILVLLLYRLRWRKRSQTE